MVAVKIMDNTQNSGGDTIDMTDKSTKKNISVAISSDDDNPSHNSQRKKTVQTVLEQSYPSMQGMQPGYFPMFTPPWMTMNYVYFDFLKQMSLESEIRQSLSRIDHRKLGMNLLDEYEAKNKVTKEKLSEENCKNKPHCCNQTIKGVSDSSFSSKPSLCNCCAKELKCRSCGSCVWESHPVKSPFHNIPCNFGKGIPDMYTSVHDQCSPFNQCHFEYPHHIPRPPYPFMGHTCGWQSQGAHQDTPFIKKSSKKSPKPKKKSVPDSGDESEEEPSCSFPLIKKSAKKSQNSKKKSVADSGDESEEEPSCTESQSSEESCYSKQRATKKSSKKRLSNVKERNNSEYGNKYAVPSYFGETDDEGLIQSPKRSSSKRTRKPQPQNTTYFLPIG